MEENYCMKMNKHLVLAMCVLFVGTVIFAGNYEFTPIHPAKKSPKNYSAIPQSETNHIEEENSRTMARRERNCVDVCAVAFILTTVGSLASYVMMRPILEGSVQSKPSSSLVQYTLKNADSRDMTITCPNSFFGTELKPGATKVVECASRSNKWSSLTAASSWGEWYAIKEGSPTIRTDAHTNDYVITRNKCQRRCVHYHSSCSGSGKNRHCTYWPHFMDEALSFTPVVSTLGDSNNSSLPSFNSTDSGYVSDIAPNNLRVRK